MKQSGLLIRVLSVLLTFCFVFSAVGSNSVILAAGNEYNENYDNMTPAEKQAYLEQKLKEVNAKLSSLGEQSGETEEYINTLDQKISYLQKELSLSKNTIDTSKKKITTLENEYKSNEAEIKTLEQDIVDLTAKIDTLQEEFNVSYNDYAQRARAMYISGNTNTLAMLLTSTDISTLFTRLEMIKRVSKQDRELLEALQNEGTELLNTKTSLEDKKITLSENQQNLVSTKENLNQTIKTLETQQVSYNEKEKSYKAEKAEADRLLLQLHEDTKTYSEYRNQDLEMLNAINAEIEQAAQEWANRQENQTTTTTTTTTTTQPTTNGDDDTPTTNPPTTAAPKPTTSSNKLSLIYPVPTQTRITCGWMGYANHTGVDFACDSGSRVVAAEDGEVIISRDITCNRNTCSNSYHGGGYCSYGKYIVIAHYKKNAAGNSVFTLYAHNSERLVSVGQQVKKGQQIAVSGSTGNSSGPHCHFEVRTPGASYNDCVNPTPYLP